MKLTWLGHACFLLEHENYRIVVDPYEGVPGYPPLRVEAHEVYSSHQHADHNAKECVTLLPPPPKESPFTVREVKTFHDENAGVERGGNLVRIFTAEGVSVAHMGDLGHHLSLEQVEAIGPLDAMMVPVGGVYTVDAVGAKSAFMALRPRCLIPMHYYHPPYGFPNIAGLDPFLKLWSKELIHRLKSASLEITPELSGVYVPQFSAE